MKKEDLFVWKPDRRSIYARVDPGGLRNSDGEPLELVDGLELPAHREISLFMKGKGKLADFLYDVGLCLIVSATAFEILASGRIPSVKPYPVSVRDRNGEHLKTYFWLNFLSAYPLLDRIRSTFRVSERGVMHEVSFFSVIDDGLPEEDLFLCDDNGARIFSANLVSRIRDAGLTGALFHPLHGSRWP